MEHSPRWTSVRHIPLLVHESGEQAWQLTPAVPQRVSAVPAWHVPVESQHPEQLAGPQATAPEQAPWTHVCPGRHAWHAFPGPPQASVVVPAWHAPLESQHPLHEP
jgi:hypothetical protein